jgi:hypothetical protein
MALLPALPRAATATTTPSRDRLRPTGHFGLQPASRVRPSRNGRFRRAPLYGAAPDVYPSRLSAQRRDGRVVEGAPLLRA